MSKLFEKFNFKLAFFLMIATLISCKQSDLKKHSIADNRFEFEISPKFSEDHSSPLSSSFTNNDYSLAIVVYPKPHPGMEKIISTIYTYTEGDDTELGKVINIDIINENGYNFKAFHEIDKANEAYYILMNTPSHFLAIRLEHPNPMDKNEALERLQNIIKSIKEQ